MTATAVTPGPAHRRRALLTYGRTTLLLVGAGLTFGALFGAIVVLLDRQGGTLLLAFVYELLGNGDAARALRLGSGDIGLAKLLLAGVALFVGVAGVWIFFSSLNAAIERLPMRWRDRLTPWLFVAPAVVLLSVYLIYPAIATIVTSLTEDGGAVANYDFALFSRQMQSAIRNNLIWLVLATGGSVLLGLLIAGLVDRIKREALAKTFIFLPLAISLVGASVIWRFVYAWQPPAQPQIGLLNAAVDAAGGTPIAWLQVPGVNTLAMIVIMVWLQTGFAMVVLSAAIKGVSSEIVEAARLDGASERQLFLRVIVPMIKGSIITVATTIAIVVLKVFDIVYVTTGGRADSDVVANAMFREMFQFGNYGQAAALAVVLFIAVVPLIVINLRNLRRQGIDA